MTVLKTMERESVRDYFSKLWLTHDAMWFYHCINEIGIEKANKINKAAVRSMAQAEVKRFSKLIGRENKAFSNFREVLDFFEQAIDLVRTDFMRVNVSSPEENVIHFEFENDRCFAFEGLSRMAFIEYYECAIFERIEAWLEGLGVSFEIQPRVIKCMKLDGGRCYRDCRIAL
jgi:hypothetical protein